MNRREDALHIADNFCASRRLIRPAYRHVAWINDNVDPSALHYLAERKSLEQADQIYRQATRLALWDVRYLPPPAKRGVPGFRRSRFRRGLRISPHAWKRMPPALRSRRIKPGRLAEQAVREHGYRLEDFELQSSDATKRKAREDYTLVWQAKPGDPRNVGDAHYRLDSRYRRRSGGGLLAFFQIAGGMGARRRKANTC